MKKKTYFLPHYQLQIWWEKGKFNTDFLNIQLSLTFDSNLNESSNSLPSSVLLGDKTWIHGTALQWENEGNKVAADYQISNIPSNVAKINGK